MSADSDPTDAIRTRAAAFPTIAPGTSCNQSAFKVGKRAFLLGVSEAGVQRLAELDPEELPEGRPPTSAFARLLSKDEEGGDASE